MDRLSEPVRNLGIEAAKAGEALRKTFILLGAIPKKHRLPRKLKKKLKKEGKLLLYKYK